MERKKWTELTGPQRWGLVAAAVVQLTLAGGAWWDLSRRPATLVHGSKTTWAFVIAINFVGPLAYLRFGRKRVNGIAGSIVPLD